MGDAGVARRSCASAEQGGMGHGQSVTTWARASRAMTRQGEWEALDSRQQRSRWRRGWSRWEHTGGREPGGGVGVTRLGEEESRRVGGNSGQAGREGGGGKGAGPRKGQEGEGMGRGPKGE